MMDVGKSTRSPAISPPLRRGGCADLIKQRYRKEIGAAGGGHTPQHVRAFDLPGSRRFLCGNVALLDRRDPPLLKGGGIELACRFIHNFVNARCEKRIPR